MSAKKRLSVVIITKNEAALLPECLTSVDFADEILVLDSGSEDNTQAVARQYGAQVFTSTLWHGFGKQRQLAQQYATGDYIFMIDADERVTPALRAAVQTVIAAPNDNVVYSCTRRNLFLGRFMRHSGWYPDAVVRLYARDRYRYNDDLVHESLQTGSVQIIPLNGDLLHLTCLDFCAFQRKQLSYAQAWAMQYYQKGKNCYYFSIFSHCAGAFLKAWLLRAGFLDGKQGLLLAIVNSQYTFNKYTALWALNHQRKYSKTP